MFASALSRNLIGNALSAYAITALARSTSREMSTFMRDVSDALHRQFIHVMIEWVGPEELFSCANDTCSHEETFHICQVVDIVAR